MKRRELLALLIVLVVVLGLPAALFGYQALRQQPTASGVRVINIVARVPEQGGFSPDRIVLQAGETVQLRISSPDVVHGLSIPGLGVNVEEILPGKVGRGRDHAADSPGAMRLPASAGAAWITGACAG